MLTGLKILIAEDDKELMQTPVHLFGVHNEVKPVSQLVIAKSHLRKVIYDLVLLDKVPPDRDGLKIIHNIKMNSKSTVVLVITDGEDYNLIYKYINAGADDYILKSEHLIQDLLIRIPVTLSNKKKIENQEIDYKKSHLLIDLPVTYDDVTPDSYQNVIRKLKKSYILTALRLCEGNVTELGIKIGLARSTMFKHLASLGLAKRDLNKKKFMPEMMNFRIEKEVFNITVVLI